ncbi:MAG: phage minor head protein [Eubacteriales bacterium]|nr:phage minor head protein [Eubacteriales bacterium]
MDAALIASDALEKTLQERIAEVYGEALKRAVRNNRLFLTNVQKLDEHAKQLEAGGWTSEKIEKWRKEEVLRLLRQQRLVQSIADEMDRAGMEIAPEIRERMVAVYKVNSDATFRHINSRVNANFVMIPREQVKIILDDTQPVFSKIAYQHLGKNRVIRSALQSQMAQAAVLGESQEKIIKRIQKVTGQAEYQARRIAQTERNRVQSQARAEALHEAAKMGITVTKAWSARMRNTRDSHAALNGTEIPESEKFHTIWGNELRYPGDPEAPAAEVINCFCVLIPDVKLPRESAADRLKKEAESGIIEGEGSLENAAEKAASIEKTFKYSDVWGDEYSPIDRASFASMPAQAQQRAADGIRKAQELFKMDALPDKIGFKKLGKGVFGEYSETRRALYLSSIECQDPEKAFGTMVHELTHYYDQVSGHIAEKVYKQALKELGLRAKGKETDTLMRETLGYFNKKDVGDPHEILAFGIEKAVCGKGNILARKLLEIVVKGRK